MNYLLKDQLIKLIHAPGKGAWTYHLQLPGISQLRGKWGSLKVSGYLDDYRIEARNLFTIKGEDKLLSVNETIRKAINKSGGDLIKASLYLTEGPKKISKDQITQVLASAGLTKNFERLHQKQKEEIFQTIAQLETEEAQIQLLLKYIEKLGGKTSF